ncbi:MAG: hypothetical protein ABIG61_09515 [Planctomycetota bacterium]
MKRHVSLMVCCLALSTAPAVYSYDANDFAVFVVDYTEGVGAGSYNNPYAALGRPALISGGDYPNMEVVVPVFQPWLPDEVVRIGQGGQLTLKFNHPVENDENNLYGIDFIMFGNAFMVIGGGGYWEYGNPEGTVVAGTIAAEKGLVAVSQDGISWYMYDANTGPWADDFASTAAYEWDEANDVWAEELDPTRPVDPNLTAETLAGKNVAQLINEYDGSAGGTGFDISIFGLDWIQYVRILDDPNSGVSTEIDAISDVSSCGDYKHPYPTGDINHDCRVDMYDFALLCGNWLECNWQCE